MSGTNYVSLVNAYYQSILRTTPSASLAQVYANQLAAGTLTVAQLQAQLLSQAQSSTIPALLSYDLFYNTTPTSGGLNFLTNYATQLQAGNYTYINGVFTLGTSVGQYNNVQFSLQNTYVNLGATFAADPSSTFKATYGSMSLGSFITQVYTQIFGSAPANATVQFLESNFQYYVNYAGSTLGGYGAIAGLLLSVAEQSNIGSFPPAANNFLTTAAQTLFSTGTDAAPYGKELIASSGSPQSSTATLTTGVDNVTANLVLADLTPFLYNGIGPTLNVGDRITGVSGQTTNTFQVNDQFGTGTDVIPAGVFIQNVQTIDLTTQGNAGGQSPAVQVGGAPGSASGVFDVTTTSSSQASTISGLTTVNVISAGSLVDNVRVDPGTLNPVNVTVNHQHVNGVGGVRILGGNNITVNDGDGTVAGLPDLDGDAPAPPAPNNGVTIGSATVVNTNNINLNPTGTVSVTEIGNNFVTIFGGTTDSVNIDGGGAVTVGDGAPVASLSYPSDEPTTSVVVNNHANIQAGAISIFAAAPVTNNGTTTTNSVTATVNETATTGGFVTVGAVSAIGGINNTYAPGGNDNITVAAQIPVAFNYATATQTGLAVDTDDGPGATVLTGVAVVGGATVNVTTNANSVVVGSAAVNGNGTATQIFPVAGENASGNVTVNDTAVVGAGAGGAAVTIVGSGGNAVVNNAGGAVTIGAVVGGVGGIVIAPVGTETVTDAAPIAYDDVINLGTTRDITTVGGTTVSITTNAGAVTVGSAAGLPTGVEPSGPVTVIDTASPGVNAGGKAPGSDVPISIFGGTNISATSANGAITIGAGTTASNPSGNVTATTNGIETGGQFASTTTVNGGANVTIATTGAGGGVVAGVKATPITGTVVITDTFTGTQNGDGFTVVGGVGPTAVSITTTKSAGAISVGGIAPVLNTTGTALTAASQATYAQGNVSIVNETPANTGVAGAANLWGTGATTVNVFGTTANPATTVTVAGGGAATITDEETTKATGGANAGNAIGASTLATVSLDHVGTGGSATTITSDALTSLTAIDDTAGDSYTVVATPALALALKIGNDAGTGKTTTVTDATASSVTVTDNGVATLGTFVLSAAKATAITFNTTAALTANLAADAKLTALTLGNTASLNLGDLTASAVAVTAGATSTGAVTITNFNGSTSSFNGAGSTGNDKITLLNNTVTKTLQAGGGATNTIIANYASGAGDVALSSEATGFNVLGVGTKARSDGRQDTITVAALGAVGAVFSITVNVGGLTATGTYTQKAGDTPAAVAAALVASLNTQLAALAQPGGVPAFAAISPAGNNIILVTSQSGLAIGNGGNNLTTVSGPAGGLVEGALTSAFFTNAYDATGFANLTAGVIAGPVSFKNVGANETLAITATPTNTISLTPTATTGNKLTINIGTDGPLTGPTAGTTGLTATVATVNTATVVVGSLGNGTTTNTLTLSDPALTGLFINGDESLTVIDAPFDPAFPGIVLASPDSAFSNVTLFDTTATTVSANTGSKNTTDLTGVVGAASGLTVNGGGSLVKAVGAQGTDYAVEQYTFDLAGQTFVLGQVVTMFVQPTTGYSIATSGPNIGKLVLGAIPVANQQLLSANYTVTAADLASGTPLQIQQDIAQQLASAVDSQIGNFVIGSAVTAGGVAHLQLVGTENAELYLAGDNFAAAFVPPPAGTPIIVGSSGGAGIFAVGGTTIYTQTREVFTTGAGGGMITPGAGGGFNPFATVTASPAGTPNTYYGVFDTGLERVNLTASAAVSDTIVVNPNTIVTFGAGNGGNSGGVVNFQETPSTAADTLSYQTGANATPYTVLANTPTGTTLNLGAGQPAGAIANTLDPSGNLANNLALTNFSSSDGLVTVIGNGGQQTPSAQTTLDEVEIYLALQANKLGIGQIAAVFDGQGDTYIVAATAGNTFAGFSQVLSNGGVPLNPLSANTGLSVVELLGDGTFTGFGSFQSPTLVNAITNPLGVVAGLGATGAVLANVANISGDTATGRTVGVGGVSGTATVYNDAGFSLDEVTATQAVTSTTTTFNSLAAAAQLNVIGGGNNVGTVVVTQAGASGSNSLIVDFQSAGDTVQSLTTSGDWALRLVADKSATVKSLTDSTGLVTTLQVTGASNMAVSAVSMAGLTTVDASKEAGALTLGQPAVGGVAAVPVNVAKLTVKGALGGDTVVLSGASNVVTVGNAAATGVIGGAVNVTATGNGDTVTLVNSATGNLNTLNVGGTSETISVDTGTNYISGGAIGGVPVVPIGAGLNVPLQSGDTVNLADGGTDFVWVGGNATVNLTGNTGTSTFGGPAAATTAFNKGGIASFASIVVKGATTGTTSAGFATGATTPGSFTTITGADTAVGLPLSLTFLNTTKEALAGGTSATSFVNIPSTVTTLSAALDTDVNQSLLMDAQIQPGADTSVVGGAINLNAKTGLLSWFQFQGSTYVVEATNNTAAAATHAGLASGDTVVKLTGLVDLSHTALTGGTLNAPI